MIFHRKTFFLFFIRWGQLVEPVAARIPYLVLPGNWDARVHSSYTYFLQVLTLSSFFLSLLSFLSLASVDETVSKSLQVSTTRRLAEPSRLSLRHELSSSKQSAKKKKKKKKKKKLFMFVVCR